MGSTRPLNEARSPWMKRHSPSQQLRRPLKQTTPSPSWKDALKQECLERARQKRQEAIWKSRLRQTARQLVEDELRESGVVIVRGDHLPMPSSLDTTSMSEDYAISEAELYELMQEVEEELQRHDEERVEEVMEEMELCERLNAQHIEEQIAEFEDWEASRLNDLVLCPICKNANLLPLSEHDVVCPNHMNGSCSLRLERSEEIILLSNLRERLQTAYELHSCTCSGPLEFAVRERDNWVILVATCSMCDSHVSIL